MRLLLCAVLPLAYGFAPLQSRATVTSFKSNAAAASAARSENLFTLKQRAPTMLSVSGDGELAEQPEPLGASNAAAAAVWVALVSWAFLAAPGELGAASDNDLIQTLISQPVPRPPEVNELWFAVWNCFAVVPLALASLAIPPAGRAQRLPAAPFLFGSGAFGYFALGPYFALRSARPGPIPAKEAQENWAVTNVYEKRFFGVNAFGALLLAITISIPFTSDLLAPTADLGAIARGYADLFASSRFVAVASVDIFIMSALAALLAREDAARRGWENLGPAVLGACVLFPVLGPAAYLAVRPPLVGSDGEPL